MWEIGMSRSKEESSLECLAVDKTGYGWDHIEEYLDSRYISSSPHYDPLGHQGITYRWSIMADGVSGEVPDSHERGTHRG